MQQGVQPIRSNETARLKHSGEPRHGSRSGSWYAINQPSNFYFYRFLPILDVCSPIVVLACVLAFFNSARFLSLASFLAIRITVKNVALLLLFAAIWTAIAIRNEVVSSNRRPTFLSEAVRMTALSTLGAMPGLLFVLTSASGAFGWLELLAFWAAVIPALLLSRILLRIAGNIASPWFLPELHCIILGSGERAYSLGQSLLMRSDARYQVLGFVDVPGAHMHPEVARMGLIGTLADLSEILKNRVVDELLVALPIKSCYSQIQAAIRDCEQAGVRCKIPSDSFSYSIARPRIAAHDSTPVLTLDVVRGQHDTLLIKRCVDLLGAVAGLIVLGPVIFLIAILVRLNSPGPAFFRQQRYGLNKRIFTIWKFRTMFQDAELRQAELEAWNEMRGPVFKIRDDPRVTSLGRFLRRTSLDELPQLWNVLTGTMSLVGPRPLPVRDVSRFSDAWLMRRFSVKPGITCLWQISGRNEVHFDRWIELDLEYIDQWSLRLDFKILARTVKAVWSGDGAV